MEDDKKDINERYFFMLEAFYNDFKARIWIAVFMEYGLESKYMEILRSVFSRHPEVERVILFGSRTKGNYKRGSDIDMAVVREQVTKNVLFSLLSEFEDSLLPFFVDLLSYHQIMSPELKEHIDRVGRMIYEREIGGWRWKQKESEKVFGQSQGT